MKKAFPILLLILFSSCKTIEKDSINVSKPEGSAFLWEAANIYFLLTDRFNNGDPSNDTNFNRTLETGKLRGFKGGDIKGVTQKIKEGYFNDLGINAIWMTPIVEQIHGGTDEGTGLTYGFHGYWTRDWTAIDPNYGTRADLKELVETAHRHGIRILLDAVINHTGPVTDKDPVWPDSWVRTEPQCAYKDYKSTVSCTLVKNLPDIKTESNEEVELPPQLVKKWKTEARYKQELKELDAFFKRTGYPRAPRFYIMKWLTDYITEFGIDGYRVDTVKHTEESVWQEFKKECDYSFAKWKESHPEEVLDNQNFFLVGEVYNYGIGSGRYFDFGDRKVDYFDNAFNSLINFDFKWNAAQMDRDSLFVYYDSLLKNPLKKYGTLNYLSSHDDGQPFDALRNKPRQTATLLLLTPGASQVYYGDETGRSLVIEGTEGDATLRSFMNWEAISDSTNTKNILEHWQKLGRFRRDHPAVGAGIHKKINSEQGYVFTRTLTGEVEDEVLVALDMNEGEKSIPAGNFKEGSVVRDMYSGKKAKVFSGAVNLNTPYKLVLFENEK